LGEFLFTILTFLIIKNEKNSAVEALKKTRSAFVA
jgi:hypothetical protein